MNEVIAQSPVIDEQTRWPAAPYKGLNFYTASDASLFCEREVDIEACARLAAHFATKMLLLHGRTGTGKSSFLRAGLFPRLFLCNANFFCLVDRQSGDPLLIRSTADPVASIISVLRSGLEDSDEFSDLSPHTRAHALEKLREVEVASPKSRAEALRSVLTLITSQLTGTFVLAIDQAEEIFTLPTSEAIRTAYFDFLEALCFERFDIKLVLALRTEYYGQFADGFRFTPDLKITPVHSGLEQFMLRGIQEPARLERAILRPTRSDLRCGEVTARDFYNFAYEDGLAAHIAHDIVQHCGESSTLPVMQMVCADLYSNIVLKKKLSVIGFQAYRDLGAVEGAIDRFIDTSIQSAVKRATRSEPSPSALEAWKDVLSGLVARQEGGALTSLLATEDRLVAEAKKHGTVRQPIDCVRRMADADLRLLRALEADLAKGPATTRYSLGHDALAPTLFQWKEARAQVLEVRESARKRNRMIWGSAAVVAVLSLVFAVINFSFAINSKRASVAAVMRSLDADQDARHRLLYLAALEANTTPIERHFLQMGDVESHLRSTLLAAPVLAYRAVSAGISRDGTVIAWLDKNGGVASRSLMDGTEQNVKASRSMALPAITTFPNLTIGFVDGLTEPVVYSDGALTYWLSGDVKTAKPLELGIAAQPFPEFAAGLLRLTLWANEAQPKYTFADFRFDTESQTFARVQRTRPISVTIPNRIAPAYSDITNDYVYAARDSVGTGTEVELVLGSRDLETHPSVLPLAVTERPRLTVSQLYQMPPGQIEETVLVPRSVAFLADRTVIVRDTASHFAIIPGPDPTRGQPAHYNISREHWSVADPVRPQWGGARPVLASVRRGTDYLLAWMTEGGVAVFATEKNHTVVPLPDQSRLLMSVRPADTFSRLKFSADGEYLSLLQPAGRETLIRVWNLSVAYRELIKSMTPDAMLAMACQITARYDVGGGVAGNALSKAEFEQLPTISLLNRQPCSGPST